MYDITKPKAPKMPTLGRGTECIKILLSQVSKDVREPPRSDAFPFTLRKNMRSEKSALLLRLGLSVLKNTP